LAQAIDYFYREHWAADIQMRVSHGARRQMFERWHAYAGHPSAGRLLDVGSTPDTERLDSNCMIPWFHQVGLQVTLYSPEDLSGLAETFSFARILPARGFGEPIPVSRREYDWVTASAVLEHVGTAANQTAFIAECARAGRGLFLTTPNRWHWLEFHTKLPLSHWLPRSTHRSVLRALKLPFWAEEKNLRLVGRDELGALATAALGHDWEWTVSSVRTLGMPSNLLLLARFRGER
jgi:hypothetical protein